MNFSNATQITPVLLPRSLTSRTQAAENSRADQTQEMRCPSAPSAMPISFSGLLMASLVSIGDDRRECPSVASGPGA